MNSNAEQFRLPLEAREHGLSHFTDVVVIRPFSDYAHIQGIVEQLIHLHFLPVLLPNKLTAGSVDRDVYDDVVEMRWFPTDHFRQIGERVLVSGGSEEIQLLQRVLRENYPQMRFPEFRSTPLSFTGAEYVTQQHAQLVFIARNKMVSSVDWTTEEELRTQFGFTPQTFGRQGLYSVFSILRESGWQIVPLDTKFSTDLDFVFSSFRGNDGKIHFLVANSLWGKSRDLLDLVQRRFQDRYRTTIQQLDYQIHIIPDAEVERGGCNIADLRNGQVLLCPSKQDCPTTYETLQTFAKNTIQLIELPDNSVDDGGGPRCSVSSFSVTWNEDA